MKKIFLFCGLCLLLSCSGLPSRSEAEEVIKKHVTQGNEADGGGHTEVTSMKIISVTRNKDKAKIVYSWSGTFDSPPLANPQPQRSVGEESDSLFVEKKECTWQEVN